MFTSRQKNYLSCSNQGVCWIHFGLGFPCSNILWRKRCRLFLQASPHFLTDKQLSLVSCLTKPCDERKFDSILKLQGGQKERRHLSVRRRAENIWVVSAGGKSRILLYESGSTEGDIYVWILVLCVSWCLLGRETTSLGRHTGNGTSRILLLTILCYWSFLSSSVLKAGRVLLNTVTIVLVTCNWVSVTWLTGNLWWCFCCKLQQTSNCNLYIGIGLLFLLAHWVTSYLGCIRVSGLFIASFMLDS